MRPICATCGKNSCAVNYIREGVTHYRGMCDECGRKKKKLKPRSPRWKSAGYKKKSTCDICDGDLDNCKMTNLRSICLNCVEVVKKKEITWKRGDLEIDY